MEKEALGVEPGFLLAVAQVLELPGSLLGMVGEGAVVDRQPDLLVLTASKGPEGDLGSPAALSGGHRERAAQLE